MSPPAEDDGAEVGADPAIPGRWPIGLAPELDAVVSAVPPPALFWLGPLFCGLMMAWMDMGICISLPFLNTARSNAMPT